MSAPELRPERETYLDIIFKMRDALTLIATNPHGISDRDTVARMQQIARKALQS